MLGPVARGGVPVPRHRPVAGVDAPGAARRGRRAREPDDDEGAESRPGAAGGAERGRLGSGDFWSPRPAADRPTRRCRNQ